MSELPVPASETSTHLPTHLAAPASRYVAAGLRGAANTQRAYAGDWRRFTAWCQTHGFDSLPAAVDTLAGFLTELAEAGKKVPTIQRHAAAIAKAHELAGAESPTADKKIKVLLQGIGRVKGAKQKQAPAFSLASFKRTVKSIDVRTPAGQRNRALLLLGFTGAFRRPELADLNIEDFTFDEEGLVVTLGKSKTNQLGQAEEKAVYYSPDVATCPIRSLQAWLRTLGRGEGPVFISLRKNNQLTSRWLTDKHINLIT